MAILCTDAPTIGSGWWLYGMGFTAVGGLRTLAYDPGSRSIKNVPRRRVSLGDAARPSESASGVRWTATRRIVHLSLIHISEPTRRS
eukprot:3642602-Prymnesium_polylepis.2